MMGGVFGPFVEVRDDDEQEGDTRAFRAELESGDTVVGGAE